MEDETPMRTRVPDVGDVPLAEFNTPEMRAAGDDAIERVTGAQIPAAFFQSAI